MVLGLGPFYLFVLQHRLPVRLMRAGWEPWLSVMSTNLAIATVIGLLVALLGVRDFLLVQAPIILLASSAGVWLFYVQHQFEHTWWAWDADWNLHTGALHGSSHYDLPPVLRWFTAEHRHPSCPSSVGRIPATGSARRCATIPSCAGSVASPSRASGACVSPCGTRTAAAGGVP